MQPSLLLNVIDSMKYNFDEIVDRKNTSCVKWDFAEKFFEAKDLLPMWVADMDFKTPDFIVEAVKKRAAHEIYGYTVRPDSYYHFHDQLD